MHTTTATQTVTPAGAPTELLSGILGMEIRNEEKNNGTGQDFLRKTAGTALQDP